MERRVEKTRRGGALIRSLFILYPGYPIERARMVEKD